MRSLPATAALLVVLALAGLAAGRLLRDDGEAGAGSQSGASAAGIRAVGAAWEEVGRREAPRLHLASVSCRPVAGTRTGWPLRCVGLLSRTAGRPPGEGLPRIELRLGPGPVVADCRVMSADGVPEADCARAAGAAL